MTENQFGRVSELRLRAACRDGKTVLKDCYFRAPFKVMKPFYPVGTDRMEIMVMSASAGIMAGDRQQIRIHAEKGARLEVTTQSFEKIHKMEDGGQAERSVRIQVEAGGLLYYNPLPAIPFAGSAFVSRTRVELENETAGFIYGEILSCGRAARGERFRYRRYRNHVQVWCGGVPMYLDNTIYCPAASGARSSGTERTDTGRTDTERMGTEPMDMEQMGLEQMDMEQIGFYEGFTHQANLVILNLPCGKEWTAAAAAVLKEQSETGRICGGITRLGCGGYAVRLLGMQAQQLQELLEEIVKPLLAQPNCQPETRS